MRRGLAVRGRDDRMRRIDGEGKKVTLEVEQVNGKG